MKHARHHDELDEAFAALERQAPGNFTKTIHWLRDPKSRRIRVPLGILFITASFFFFLPVLGLWLLPVGLLLIAQDAPFLRRPVGRMTLWLERKWIQLRERLRRQRERRRDG